MGRKLVDQRQIRVILLPMGRYSKVLILPRWWLRLNGDPEAVDVNFNFIAIRPVKTQEPQNEEVASGKQWLTWIFLP